MSAPANVPSRVGFSVSWSAVSEATSYTVRSTDLTMGAGVTRYTGSATNAVVTIGVPDIYQMAVQACNAKDCSGWTTAAKTTNVNAPNNNAIAAGGSSP